MITLVYQENIQPMWPLIEPLIRKCTEIEPTHAPEDVLTTLLDGTSQLWVEWDKGPLMAVVTQLVRYPRGTRLRVWLGAAKDGMKINHKKIDEYLVEFAKANQCIGMEMVGRDGWGRLFKDAERKAQYYTRDFTKTLQ